MSKVSGSNLWGDLEGLDSEGITRIIKEKKDLLRTIDGQIRDLQSERKEQVHIVKALRSAVVGFENSDSGRKKLLAEFHSSRKSAQKQRQKRDSINESVPPPSKILEEWLSETFDSLTSIDNDLTSVPMLNPELTAFSRFFEIQASIKRKRQAEKAHSDYIKKVGEMRRISSKLDQNKEVSNKVVSELKENVEIEYSKSDDNRSYHINSTKISDKLGFFPKKNINEAIKDLIDAFKKKSLTNTFENEDYFNIKKMQKINLV